MIESICEAFIIISCDVKHIYFSPIIEIMEIISAKDKLSISDDLEIIIFLYAIRV